MQANLITVADDLGCFGYYVGKGQTYSSQGHQAAHLQV